MASIMTLAEFDRLARETEVMGHRHIIMDVQDCDGNRLDTFEGYDQLVLNVAGLYDLRARLASPALRDAVKAGGADNLDPEDLQTLKERLMAHFSDAGWSAAPLTEGHIARVTSLIDNRLQAKRDYAMSLPESLTWEFASPSADEELNLFGQYNWTCGFNRLQLSFVDVLDQHFGKAHTAAITYRPLETPAEFEAAFHEIASHRAGLARLSAGPYLN